MANFSRELVVTEPYYQGFHMSIPRFEIDFIREYGHDLPSINRMFAEMKVVYPTFERVSLVAVTKGGRDVESCFRLGMSVKETFGYDPNEG